MYCLKQVDAVTVKFFEHIFVKNTTLLEVGLQVFSL